MGVIELFDPDISKRKRDRITREILQFAAGYPINTKTTSGPGVTKRIKTSHAIDSASKKSLLFFKLDKEELPRVAAFYALRLKTGKIRSVSGKSTPYLYFGHTKDLRKRAIDNYYNGNGGSTTKRINLLLMKKGYKEGVELAWSEVRGKEQAKSMETKLRDIFYNEYDQLPAWNRQA